MAVRTAAVLQEIAWTAGSGAAGATDRELLRRFAEAGVAALFRRHAGMVLGVCRRALSLPRRPALERTRWAGAW
jgi:hypothetical protein